MGEDAYRPLPYAELSPMLTEDARKHLDPREEYGVVWYPRRQVKRLEPDPTRNYRGPQRVSWHAKEEQIPIPVVSSGIPPELIDRARAAIADNRRPPRSTARVFELAGVIRSAERLEAISLEDLVARTAELDRERDRVKRLLADHESRQERLIGASRSP